MRLNAGQIRREYEPTANAAASYLHVPTLRQRRAPTQNLSAAELTAAVAERVFGWKQVQEQEGELIGKKQDKAGRWRTTKVPDYANDPRQASAIEERIKQLGRLARYLNELSEIAKANNLPGGWATPE